MKIDFIFLCVFEHGQITITIIPSVNNSEASLPAKSLPFNDIAPKVLQTVMHLQHCYSTTYWIQDTYILSPQKTLHLL